MFQYLRRFLLSLALAGALVVPASGFTVPPRGTDERTDMLDAVRPLAAWLLAAPIEFVVLDIRLEGDVGFVNVAAQRPGGFVIDLAESPIVTRDGENPDNLDGATMQALLQRSGRIWVAVHHSLGATDLWFSNPAYCPVWGPVLPEVCQ